ncbi:peptide alpha-N-acetyltransferase complex A subunit NAT1 [Nakaseomyces bracarensis]|uniref:peptide alpha-N-acetyltransferase complex A subunit NAT1 n=1 Tax=Nakaseomyces bracarensis TaxID=273131 RepID=UPI003871226C
MSRRRGGAKPKLAPKVGIKDTSQFLEALKLYEAKNYKKSIKLLDTVLKKESSNVDCLALKGLDLHSIGEKEEAEQLVKSSISKISGTSASPMCCHILGIYMRNVKDYHGSIKWFQASLDNGSNNFQIYRDLATLYSQVGDFKKALVARKAYWETYMGYRANWTGLAVCQDINGERQQAVNTLSQFEKLASGKISDAEKYEHNECLIYKNDIMYRNAGNNPEKLQKVMNHLNDIEKDVFDKYAVLERKASIYMKLGNMKDASIMYRTLIKRNPDNFKYYNLLEVALGIRADNRLRKALYEKLEKFYPNCDPPRYIPLTFIQDEEELTKKLEDYILPMLKRGVPATFSSLKNLYRSRGERIIPIIQKFVTQYLESLDKSQNQIQYIWTCYFLTQHYLFIKDFKTAQQYIDNALEHTPTMVEFYIMKARVLKHLGLLDTASEILEEARELDLQDRFINCKSVKYLLRANKIDKAVEVASLFTKNEDAVNGLKDLHLVEASWFIVEQAEAYYRLYLDAKNKLNELQKELEMADNEEEKEAKNDEIKVCCSTSQKYQGLALKRFIAISKFYKQFDDDQLDFHSYCMRKGTPRAYLEMLEWGKKLFTKPMYVRAMEGSSKIYFELYDSKAKRENDGANENGNENTKKAKKENAAARKLREEEEAKVMAYPKDQDQDPFGEKLINTAEPLSDFSSNFYNDFLRQATADEKDYLLDFEYNLRTGKLALCLSDLAKVGSKYGKDSFTYGAMSVALLICTKPETSYDEIAKKVVEKSLTENGEFNITDRDNSDFDWLEYLQSKFKSADTSSYLFLYRHSIGNPEQVKGLIIDQLSNAEPYEQSKIIQYNF